MRNLKSIRGFTLVEVLVSMSVLVLLVVMVTRLINDAAAVSTISRKHMDADSEARLIFDRMSKDFAGMVLRSDVDYRCKGMDAAVTMSGANDTIYFYSEAPGSFTSTTPVSQKCPIALLGYRVNTNNPYFPGIPVLERLGKGLTWDGSPDSNNGVLFSPAALTAYKGASGAVTVGSPPNYDDGTDDDFHVLGEGVYRFEYAYLLKPNSKEAGTGSYVSLVPFSKTDSQHQSVNGFKDVAAIVVTLAILDPESCKKVPASAYADLIKSLADAQASGFSGMPTTAKNWLNTVNSPGFASACGIPQVAAGQFRIYQRTFYFNQ